MKNAFLQQKQRCLEEAWSFVQAGELQASQDVLSRMDPEMQDCEQFHTIWLSTLIFAERWRETETYARRLVDRHGGYYLSAWHALVNGLCGQGKYAEANAVLEEAIANWPCDALLRAIAKKLEQK